MAAADLPSFLHGTFDWRFRGLNFAQTPPNGLLTPASLGERNPWIVLATVVELARQGDHSHAQTLSRYYDDKDTPALARVSLMLTGDVARQSDLVLLQQALQSDDPRIRMYAAEGAALAGQIWLVGDMLRAWENAEEARDHEVIGFSICDLLEKPGGDLESYADSFPFKDVDKVLGEIPGLKGVEEQLRLLAEGTPEFVHRTEEAYRTTRSKLANDQVFIFEGDMWTMESFVRQLQAQISQEVAPGFYNYRHRFEAYTGIDCTSFFRGGSANRLAIMATLETFTESNAAANYLPGCRYFAGHLIPA